MTETNTPKKKNKLLSFLLSMLVSLAIGVGLGLLLVLTLKDSGKLDVPFGQFMLTMLVNLLLLYLALYLQFIFHEGGHYVFGKLTGYGFILFRIGSLTWIRGDEGIKLKRMSLAGTGGQCLMTPPEWNDGVFPYKLYNFGGAIMNLITAVVFFVIYLFVRRIPYLSFLCLCLTVMGVIVALLNGIPMRMSGVDNDGNNVVSLSKSKDARWAFWTQMVLCGDLARGKRLIDAPEEYFTLPEGNWQDNALTATIAVLKENRHMDAHEFDKAEELLHILLDEPNALAQLHKNMLVCDRMYLEAIGECNPERIAALDTKEHRQFRKAMKEYITIIRTEYALALLHEKNSEKAETLLLAFEKRCPTHPNPGECVSERELMDIARQKAETL
ncbi:MAG: M50 family metallopeptidase [Clostridiales bacterium]|nr:M50 family metallopeptidase [Clostridiales bacterium]